MIGKRLATIDAGNPAIDAEYGPTHGDRYRVVHGAPNNGAGKRNAVVNFHFIPLGNVLVVRTYRVRRGIQTRSVHNGFHRHKLARWSGHTLWDDRPTCARCSLTRESRTAFYISYRAAPAAWRVLAFAGPIAIEGLVAQRDRVRPSQHDSTGWIELD